MHLQTSIYMYTSTNTCTCADILYICTCMHLQTSIYMYTSTNTCTCADILEGNSKGIMRVVLALAERYQPRSVKQRSVSDPKPYAVFQQQGHAHFNRDHTPPDRFSTRDHMTPDRPPPIAPRTRSPDEFRPRSHNVMSSSLAANSFSVPNMASLNVHAPRPAPSRPTSGRKSYDYSNSNLPHAQGYGPPQIGQGPSLSRTGT